jgi:hypothetical protein
LAAPSNQEFNMHKRFLVLVSMTALATLAQAGPPLVCHPFDTGGAKSLPWAASANWNSPDRSYDLKRLVPDTLSLLSPETAVVVRMETMRRAAIYANKDPRVAYELLSRLMARALESGSAPALFDSGYLVETYKQVHLADRAAGYVPLATDLDGYALVVKAIRLGGDTASMEFAAALMGDRPWPNEHFRKALAASSEGSLLATNIVHQFGEGKQTLSELRARYGNGK